ncbi:gas vesicle protein [Halococcus sp. AFM35]|uniref:gas vesicle protein GvpO n=1 Tax=Halococcus sp. AFM35 TaxID=3421653 RepID=UPI003EBEE9B5
MVDLDPSERTIDELRDELDGIDDPEALEELRETEADGEDRSGAKEAIDERLATVSGEGDEADGGDTVGIVEVRDRVRENASDLIGRPLDGIVEIEREDGEWRALVEIIERNSVPDTQDILGRYALDLDGNGEITGYRRLERYRRGDTRRDEQAPAGGR